MSKLFGRPSMPAPQPVPVNPANDPKAAQAKLDAERAAVAESQAAGRRSTVAAGGAMAEAAQYERGLLKKAQRSAVAEELLG